LTGRASLRQAIAAFQEYMRTRDFSPHTVRAFNSDLRILEQYIGAEKPIGDIGTRDLNEFVRWLTSGRGEPCSPKSLSRRITTLKVFFSWLAETGVLPEDPAAPVIHRPVLTPLPRVLNDEEVARVLEVVGAMRRGDPPDARPYLLVSLLLNTGSRRGSV
jgi:integrase/recombinase XerD